MFGQIVSLKPSSTHPVTPPIIGLALRVVREWLPAAIACSGG
jgi:hypothetical protein